MSQHTNKQATKTTRGRGTNSGTQGKGDSPERKTTLRGQPKRPPCRGLPCPWARWPWRPASAPSRWAPRPASWASPAATRGRAPAPAPAPSTSGSRRGVTPPRPHPHASPPSLPWLRLLHGGGRRRQALIHRPMGGGGGSASADLPPPPPLPPPQGAAPPRAPGPPWGLLPAPSRRAGSKGRGGTEGADERAVLFPTGSPYPPHPPHPHPPSPRPPSPKPSHGTDWAVLIAGSAGWGNYRHQADICHVRCPPPPGNVVECGK